MRGREGNFAPINCSAIPKDLFESELFGHKKGAFSSAFYDKKGAFEYANQGTLFLDEIGEMPLEMQAKVLRAVEYRTINRLGDMTPIQLDLRIVFATNRDLKKEVDEGRFRKDLFFRIFSPSFRIIPLRERIEDIPLLVEHFLDICTEKFQKQVKAVSPTLMSMFKRYAWDGNVRELIKVIEMGVINARDSIITEKEISSFTDNLMNGQEIKDDDLAPASKVTDVVLVVEDVVTKGGRVQETIDIVRQQGGQIVGVAMIVDRSGGEVDLGVPMFSLITMAIETFPADQLPDDLATLPAVKPGSK